MFTHLHTHSHYTLLTALPTVDQLLARAQELGMTSLALTDTNNLYGAVEFYTHAKNFGIKPILGAELLVTKDLHSKNNTAEDRRRHQIVLLVENETGYLNLMQIISVAQLEGFYYKPRTDKNFLRSHHEGLIALSGSMTGEIPGELIYGNYEKAKMVALEYQEIFGAGNFFLELGPHQDNENQMAINQGLVQISRETGIPLVAACDSHYLRREDSEIQDILICIRDNKKVTDTERFTMRGLDLSFRSDEEMRDIFAAVPEAISNTEAIAERIDFHLHTGENHLPEFPLPPGKSADDYLQELCDEGLTKRYPNPADITDEHRERLVYEMGIIKKTGFASYFLIVQDFVNWAKDNGVVVGPGRGSAAGSFVAYLTGITNVDPIKFNLLFERFLNPERISMPDVDMDFADTRRDDVLSYVRRKYGEDRVAQIITFGTMAARAAVRDVGRALGYPYDICDKTSKMIPMFTSIGKALEEVPEFQQWYATSAEAKKLIDAAKTVEGLARHTSMHACGVVITKDPVTTYTPLQKVSGSREGVVTQYASSTKANAVEKIGLLKMDFLGLKNLTIIENCLRIVRKTKGDDIDIDTLPIDDEATYALFQRAETTGVFQLESSGMKRYLKQLKPTVFEDLIAMVALYRPGPMDYIPDFIGGKHGTKEVEYLHPKLEPILANTYGVAVYQEQLMQIARDLAGFSLGEADVLRKAVGKKIKELVAEQKEIFVAGCVKNNISQKVAENVFAFIEPFAGYGFNRSHAACYALIGYQTAYLKAHYPAEFMAALLTSSQDHIDRVAVEVREAREMGIEVLPPHINESFEDFAVITENGTERIRFGINAIKNVGHVIAAAIVAERKQGGKFTSLENFLERVQNKDLNKKSLEALIKVGAFEGFGERGALLANIDALLHYSKNLRSLAEVHSQSLFGAMDLPKTELRLVATDPAPKKAILLWEKELLGLYVSDHPLNEFAAYMKRHTFPLANLAEKNDDMRVTLGGIISTVRKVITKKGTPMYFITLEDLTGQAEILVFGRVAEQSGDMLREDEIITIDTKVSYREGEPRMSAESIQVVRKESLENEDRIAFTQEVQTGLDIYVAPTASKQNLESLATTLSSLPAGPTAVIIHFQDKRIRTSKDISLSDEARALLATLPFVTLD
jgi:DNA polymerase-3 subunit alpha